VYCDDYFGFEGGFPMAQIKSLDRINAKWLRVTQASQAEYEEGVTNPSKDWGKETLAANASYKAGLAKSLSNDSFAKGVQSAGTAKWQKNAIEKGPARFAQGVQLSVDSYALGYRPYREAIQALTLTPRGPKGDATNINRVALIARTLHDLKVKGGK
jgi:hypothetical protein